MALCAACIKKVDDEMERLFLIQTMEIKRLTRELQTVHQANRSLEHQRAGYQAVFEELGRKRLEEGFGSDALKLF